jgi:hypothetical protein
MELITKLLRLERLILQRKDEIITTAGFELLADVTERIFVNGLAADGSKIGQYSKKEIWIPVPAFGVSNSNLSKTGKRGKKTKSTKYFKDGYSQFRGETGRQNSFVDLNLSSQLFLSVKFGVSGSGYAIGIVGEEEAKKARGNEKRFGKDIFSLTDEERKKFLSLVSKEYNKILQEIFD